MTLTIIVRAKIVKTAPKRIRADPAALPVNPRVSITNTFEDFAKGLMAAFRGEENLYPETLP